MRFRPRRRLIYIGLGAVPLVFVLWLAFAMVATRWPTIFDWSEMREATRDIAAVDSFLARYGSLPETLSQAGIAESDSMKVYYRKQNDQEYIVWFGTVLGESATYESSTEKWR
jgi:hypothetical protein